MEKSKKRFDAVALMRKIRDKMSRDVEGMSYEEQKHFLKDRFRLGREKETVGSDEDRIS
jgi:thermostable 8-oxoguanine DNA glycosylase